MYSMYKLHTKCQRLCASGRQSTRWHQCKGKGRGEGKCEGEGTGKGRRNGEGKGKHMSKGKGVYKNKSRGERK